MFIKRRQHQIDWPASIGLAPKA